jgi:hypothetical protein
MAAVFHRQAEARPGDERAARTARSRSACAGAQVHRHAVRRAQQRRSRWGRRRQWSCTRLAPAASSSSGPSRQLQQVHQVAAVVQHALVVAAHGRAQRAQAAARQLGRAAARRRAVPAPVVVATASSTPASRHAATSFGALRPRWASAASRRRSAAAAAPALRAGARRAAPSASTGSSTSKWPAGASNCGDRRGALAARPSAAMKARAAARRRGPRRRRCWKCRVLRVKAPAWLSGGASAGAGGVEAATDVAAADDQHAVGRAHRQGFRQGERGSRRMAASLGRRLPARGRKSRPNGRQIVAGASRRRPLQAGSNWRRRVACQCASCAASMGRANR